MQITNQTQKPVRINVGGDSFIDSSNRAWEADSYYKGGQLYTTTSDIEQTTDDTLFQGERFQKNLAYAIPVQKGTYKVNLNFAENYFNERGKRIFDVSAENSLKLNDFDIYAAAGGPNKPVQRSFEIEVTDGVLNLDLSASLDNAKLSSIEVQQVNPEALPTTLPGSGWTKVFEDNFDGNSVDQSLWYSQNQRGFDISATEVSNGTLKIHNTYDKNGTSTGAFLKSKESFKFGYFEAEVHIDQETDGKIWPTWWIWGGKKADGRSTTEFDLSEYSGFSAKYADNRPTSTHHYRGKEPLFPENSPKTESDHRTSSREKTEPHKWGMLWTPWEVSFYYDGQKYMTSDHPEDAADLAEELNLHLTSSPHIVNDPNGTPSNPLGGPKPGETLPSFVVNYARVWQRDSYFDMMGNAIRINAGGDAFTDNSGNVWSEDKYFRNGNTYITSAEISQTTDDPLLQSERYQSNLDYTIPLERGTYTVNLKFAENYFDTAGSRVFDVLAEGNLKLDDVDIYAATGSQNMILEKSFQVDVQDGILDLNLRASNNNAQVSAIEILPSTPLSI